MSLQLYVTLSPQMEFSSSDFQQFQLAPLEFRKGSRQHSVKTHLNRALPTKKLIWEDYRTSLVVCSPVDETDFLRNNIIEILS